MAMLGNRLERSRGNNLYSNYAGGPGSPTPDSYGVSDPSPVSGLWEQFLFEEGVANALVGTVGVIIASSNVRYQTAAAVHGSLGLQLTGSASNFRLRAPGHSYQMSVYGSFSAMAVGTSSVLNLDDETLSTNAGGGIAFTSADGLTGSFAVTAGVAGASSTPATGVVSIGELFRLDFKTVYTGSAVTNTLRLFYGTNIEGTVPDETISATHAVTAYGNQIRWGNSSTFNTNYDTLRIYDVATDPTPFVPSALLNGSGTLSASSTPAIAVGAALGGSGSLGAAAQPVIPTAGGLSGSGTLSATTAVAAPAALSGAGTLSAAVSPTIPAPAALSGSGALQAAGKPTIPAPAAPNGSGTLSATVTPTIPVPAALAGAGTLSAAVKPSVAAPAALSGAGTLSAAPKPTIPTPAALSGSGTLSATGIAPGGASLTGSGTLTAAVQPTIPIPAAPNGTGTLSAAAKPSVAAPAALSGAGTLSAAPKPTIPTPAALAGSGTLTAVTTLAVPTPAALAGSGTLSATGARSGTSAGLSGDGSLTATRVPTVVFARLAPVATSSPALRGYEISNRRRGLPPNERRLQLGELAWVGPIDYRPRVAVLALACLPAGVTPAEGDWSPPTLVNGKPGAMLALGILGTYGLWARDANGDPTRFATVTVS